MNNEAMEVLNHEVTVPLKLLDAEQIELMKKHAINVLLAEHTASEAYVLLYQMESLVKQIREDLKDKAIARVNGKEENILGAIVTLRKDADWTYDSPTLDNLSAEIKELQEKVKKHKRALEAGIEVLGEGGVIETATKIKDGCIIAVKLPK